MKNIRGQFPILTKKINGRAMIYFDNAATSQKPQSVINSMVDFYTKHNSNVHRGINPLAEEATRQYENARKKVKEFINANSTQEIIFTKGATESINLIAQSWGRKNLKKGDIVVLSIAEHHANFVPWLQLKKEIGIEIDVISLTGKGYLDIQKAKNLLTQKKVKLLALTLCSNVLGAIETRSIVSLQKIARANNIKILLDASQAISHIVVNVKKLNCDFLAFSGHKMFGPTGCGVLYGKNELLEKIPAWQGGGDMIREVFTNKFSENNLPYKFEAGTPNIAGAIGLGVAVDFIKKTGFKNILKKEEELTNYFLKKIKECDFAVLHGPTISKDRILVFSLTIKGVHPHDAADALGQKGIILRAGHHCAQPLHDYLKVSATLRASLSFYNTTEEIDLFFKELKKVYQKFN